MQHAWVSSAGRTTGPLTELLFAGSVEDATASESHGSSGVTFEVGMNCKSCMDKPTDDVKAVSRKDEFIVPGFGKEDHET